MTDIIILIVTTLLTTGYAALMSALADKSPELAAVGAIAVVILWFTVGHIYFF